MLALLLGRKETQLAPGPLVPDPQHPPRVILRRGHDSATLAWEPGRMHSGMPAWTALRSRLEAAGFVEAIDAWIEHHARDADPRPEREGTARYGRVLHVPLDRADALAGLVVGYLAQAVAAPLTTVEFALRFPDYAPSPALAEPPANAPVSELPLGRLLIDPVELGCPLCAPDPEGLTEHVHFLPEAIIVDPSGRGQVRGSVICLPGWCEREDHRFTFCFGHHKGRTVHWIEDRTGKRLPGDPIPEAENAQLQAWRRSLDRPAAAKQTKATPTATPPPPVVGAPSGPVPGFIIPWVYFGQGEHEPFAVIPWTGQTRERGSEALDSPEWEGIAPDGERLWFSGSESALLECEGRQGSELYHWLLGERARLIASVANELAPPANPSARSLASQVVEAAERWELALAVSIEAVVESGEDVRSTTCYLVAENGLRDAIEALHIAKGLAVRSERVLPSFGELEQAAREHLDSPLPQV